MWKPTVLLDVIWSHIWTRYYSARASEMLAQLSRILHIGRELHPVTVPVVTDIYGRVGDGWVLIKAPSFSTQNRTPCT